MRVLEAVLGLLLTAFGVFAAVEAGKLRIPAGSLTQDLLGPGFFPFWLGVAIAGLAAAGLGQQILLASAESPPLLDPRGWRPLGIMAVGTVAYVAAIGFLGFTLATFVFILGVLVALRQRAVVGALTAALVTGTLYLIFAWWLQVPLPTGPLGF